MGSTGQRSEDKTLIFLDNEQEKKGTSQLAILLRRVEPPTPRPPVATGDGTIDVPPRVATQKGRFLPGKRPEQFRTSVTVCLLPARPLASVTRPLRHVSTRVHTTPVPRSDWITSFSSTRLHDSKPTLTYGVSCHTLREYERHVWIQFGSSTKRLLSERSPLTPREPEVGLSLSRTDCPCTTRVNDGNGREVR